MTHRAETLGRAGRSISWSGIARRVGEQDIERQLLFNRVRRIGVRAFLKGRVPDAVSTLLPEYLKILVGSAIGFWLIAALLEYALEVEPVYTLAAFGFFYSVQSTYHKHRLSREPGYRIPRCGCAQASVDDTEKVLRSAASCILGIPNSAVGAVFFPTLAFLAYAGHSNAAVLVALSAVLAGAYLAHVMIVRIAGLCSTCISIAALSVLILWQLLP